MLLVSTNWQALETDFNYSSCHLRSNQMVLMYTRKTCREMSLVHKSKLVIVETSELIHHVVCITEILHVYRNFPYPWHWWSSLKGSISSIPSWPQTHYVTEFDLKLLNLLLYLLSVEGYSHAPPYLVYLVLRIEPRYSCESGKHSITEPHSSPQKNDNLGNRSRHMSSNPAWSTYWDPDI